MAPPAWYNQITPHTYSQYGVWEETNPDTLTGGLFLLILFLHILLCSYWKRRHQQTEINSMKGERGGGAARRYCKDRLLLYSLLCPRVNRPIVCGIHRVPCNFNDPQHAQISWFTSRQPPVFIWKKTLLRVSTVINTRRLGMRQRVLIWFYEIRYLYLIPRRDSSDLLFSTGSSVHMHIMSRNTENGGKKYVWEAKQLCPCSRKCLLNQD